MSNKFLIIVGVFVVLGSLYLFTTQKGTISETQEVDFTNPEITLLSDSEQSVTVETIKNFMNKVTIETNYGTIAFETYDKDAPKTVKNFITLAEKGFYNNLIFHRVVKNFVIQGGDPLGTGTGGPGYSFEDELTPGTESAERGYVKGTVAMANSGPNTNGSQFFIMLENVQLSHDYTIFGRVISGQDVVDAIGKVETTNERPDKPVIMKSVSVEPIS